MYSHKTWYRQQVGHLKYTAQIKNFFLNMTPNENEVWSLQIKKRSM